jgi:ubiquinone biosynthesis protein
MRGKPVSELSVGQMLDGLFAITRDFDMETQPHLLLLQKTMVMVEGVATMLHPGINMWETSGPFVKEWIRTELGPETQLADRINRDLATLNRLPELIRRIEDSYPKQGAAPPAPPLPDVPLMWERREKRFGLWSLALTALGAGAIGAVLMRLFS